MNETKLWNKNFVLLLQGGFVSNLNNTFSELFITVPLTAGQWDGKLVTAAGVLADMREGFCCRLCRCYCSLAIARCAGT